MILVDQLYKGLLAKLSANLDSCLCPPGLFTRPLEYLYTSNRPQKTQEKHTSELFGSSSHTIIMYFIGVPIDWKHSLHLCVSTSDFSKSGHIMQYTQGNTQYDADLYYFTIRTHAKWVTLVCVIISLNCVPCFNNIARF